MEGGGYALRFCTLVVLLLVIRLDIASASNVQSYQFSAEEKQDLMRYANNTWNFMKASVNNITGLPARRMMLNGYLPSLGTVASFACYLWSVIVARDLDLITSQEAITRLRKTLKTLTTMERYNGHYFKSYSTTTLLPAEVKQHVSSVDSGWLAVGLILVKNAIPELWDEAETLLADMDFNLLRNEATGFFCRSYEKDKDNRYCETYNFLNGETRIAMYVGIGRKQVPQDMYFKLTRTPIPNCNGNMEMMPGGEFKTYMGVRVFEGHFEYRNMKIVPSNGGSMFEALMVPLFVPEVEWGAKSWGVNHPLYARAQIEHGLEEAKYGLWGFSPCDNPSQKNDYREYGVDAIGNSRYGYYSNNDKTGVDYGFPNCPNTDRIPVPDPPSSAYTNGVVTSHAIFIAMPFQPKKAMDALKKLEKDYDMFGKFGFRDSVNVQTKEKGNFYLAFDQGMIMAVLGNALKENLLKKYFAAEPGMRDQLEPILRMEEFTAGEIGV